jgi:hypothetical protein
LRRVNQGRRPAAHAPQEVTDRILAKVKEMKKHGQGELAGIVGVRARIGGWPISTTGMSLTSRGLRAIKLNLRLNLVEK